MGWLEFLSSILNSWPLAFLIVVVFLAHRFRDAIADRLAHLRAAEYKGARLEFEQVLDSLPEPEQSRVTQPPLDPGTDQPPDPFDEIKRAAATDPARAVARAWSLVERELESISSSTGISKSRTDRYTPPHDPAFTISTLHLREWIDPETSNLLKALLYLRDQVAHPHAYTDEEGVLVLKTRSGITSREARDYIRRAELAVDRLRRLSSREP